MFSDFICSHEDILLWLKPEQEIDSPWQVTWQREVCLQLPMSLFKASSSGNSA